MEHLNALPCSCGPVGSASEVGDGTLYPIAWDLTQMMNFYWKIKSATPNAVVSGVSECEQCNKALSGNSTNNETIDRAPGVETMSDLVCESSGAFSWSAEFENEAGDPIDGIAADVSLDACDVKYYDGSYYMRVQVTVTVALEPDTLSAPSDSYSGGTSSPPSRTCPAILIVNNWKDYTESTEEPPGGGTFSFGPLSVPLYVIMKPDQECDVSASNAVINWVEGAHFAAS